MSVARVPPRETPSRALANAVRSATGADQEWFARTAMWPDPIDAACALIERCTDATAEDAIDLPVGTRMALLWQIRQASFGNELDAVVECTSCHEKLDVALSIDELIDQPEPDDPPPFAFHDDGRRVRFRLPTGHDQQAAARAADPARELCRRCIVDVDGASPNAVADDSVDQLIDVLSEAVAQVDPRADALLTATCPACESDFTAELDAYWYLREELLAGAERILEEIHVLASKYNWSERDILALPVGRRRAYLDLVAALEQP